MSCKDRTHLPDVKRMSTGLGECLQEMSASLIESGPVTVCSQSESFFGRFELCFNSSRDPFPNIHDIPAARGDIRSDSERPDMDEPEENDVERRSSIESDDDSDCMIIDNIIPTIDITEEDSDEEGKVEMNQKLNNAETEELENRIEKSHRSLRTSNCDSSVIDLSKDSDGELVGSEENETIEFAENIVASEDVNNNESLPDGWIIFSHDSGLPTYYHAESKVCTMTRPYFIGPLGVRGHKVPVEAIPCLGEKRRKKMAVGANPQHLVSAKKIHAYCKKNLFKFKIAKSLYHGSWKKKRWYDSMVKRYREKKMFSHKVQLPVRDKRGKDVMVPFDLYNKPCLMLLSEYVNLAFRKEVVYRTEELQYHGQNFLAKAFIDGSWYGSGIGSTKKLAKHNAAQFVFSVILGVSQANKLTSGNQRVGAGEQDVLDDVSVDDPRVTSLCKTKNEMLPFAMLERALKRNKNLNELKVRCEILNEGEGTVYVMEVGQYAARVKCRNKIDGKHEAAQQILKQIHPIVRSWGGLVRLYRESFDFEEEDDGESVNVKREVDRGLLDELKCQFSKLNEERSGQVVKSHYDTLWEPKLLRYNPSFGSEDYVTEL